MSISASVTASLLIYVFHLFLTFPMYDSFIPHIADGEVTEYTKSTRWLKVLRELFRLPRKQKQMFIFTNPSTHYKFSIIHFAKLDKVVVVVVMKTV